MEKNVKIGIGTGVGLVLTAVGTWIGIKWYKRRKKNGTKEDKQPEVITAEANKPANERPEEKKEEGDKK